MLRTLITALMFLAIPACTPATSEPDERPWPEILASDGLSATDAHLSNAQATSETAFILGSVRFLRAMEVIMQTRYANYSGRLPLIPGMRNQLPPNPNAEFRPDFLETALTDALVHLAAAETALAPAVDGEFGVEVDLASLWFDVNADGERAEWEGVLALMGDLGAEPADGFDGVIRFDTADAEWMLAYVHVVSGMSELTLSLNPTPAIQTVTEGRSALEQFGAIEELGLVGDNTVIDTVASVLLTLRGVPDANRTQAAHGHFQAMMSHNRRFWSEIELETDNNREWLPNSAQSSAFGIEVDADTANAWQDVLGEINEILSGDKLVPYWRMSGDENSPVGLNIAKFMQEPGDMDLVLWIQGTGAAPFLERGRIADMAAWEQFVEMTRGDSLILAAWFN
jgi:hypothetical protein